MQDRRATPDRRRRPTSPLQCFLGYRRRRGFRRRAEGEKRYVDRLRAPIIVWAVVIMVLCSADAYLTLLHIESGGEELVPTMKWALSISSTTFLWLKLVLTGFGALYLAAHQNFPVARFCIRFVFFTYFMLMIYHGYVILVRERSPAVISPPAATAFDVR